MNTNVFYASQIGAKLDCNVYTGGGTDDTAVLQECLDKALTLGNLHLIMDGAALITGLYIHSNTTIECLNHSCGFFLKDYSNRTVIQNANIRMNGEVIDKNITLIGGTYNQNGHNQLKNKPNTEGMTNWVMGMQFYGVENFIAQNITIQDARTFASCIANFHNVKMENIHIDNPELNKNEQPAGRNQDGLHFFGPGQLLSLKNIRGRSGDDLIAITTDELDHISGITDIYIDGVFANDCSQVIRLLSVDKGRLDRVIIKNVTGTYKSFGFFINPHKPGKFGNFGNIIIDTVDLRQSEPIYHYTSPFLLRIHGRIESITLKNIFHHLPKDQRPIIELGWPETMAPYWDSVEDKFQRNHEVDIKSIVVDGLHIYTEDETYKEAPFISVLGKTDNFVLRNCEVISKEKCAALIELSEKAQIDNLLISNVLAKNIDDIVRIKSGEIKHFFTNFIVTDN